MLLIALFGISAFHMGLIWMVQLVHYPGFAEVGDREYAAYQAHHMRTISWIVMPSMVLELALSIIAIWYLASLPYFVSLGLLGIIWLTTIFGAVPIHRNLTGGKNVKGIGRLVKVNWYRTASWTLRTLLLGYLCFLAEAS
ncbi:hypothetical protein [Marinoscillum furvescens]|uniref:DUF1772 domain-containing protein n=1 Tax=Marinoscillum furvescens DSM 4134 TaxID=1122208 RepID=A0A3D9L5Q4_MARFU|nr:hypothetical protein [Marinoscillum furvescens]REE01508.1 hypothetical protein C7460_10324 [Marinoscillum furvescens DSM 4134]